MPLPLGWTLAVLAMSLFGSLGAWQWGRAEQKEAMLAATAQVLRERAPRPLSLANEPARAGTYDWAAGDGEFLPAPPILLDNQTRERQPGVRVYGVFQPAAGGAPLLVELGWLPVPPDRRMPVVALPAGRQRIAGLLAPPPSEGIARSAPAPQAGGALLVIAVERGVLEQALGLSLARRVLKLDPDLPIGYARDLDVLPNTLPPERHIGYAVQWFGLALAVLATALVLTWRAHRAPRQGQ